MSSKRVLYISQEITPYLPESPTSINSRYLPQAIQEKGQEIRTFMPKYGSINERRNQLHEVIRLSGMNLIINDTDHPLIIKVASIQPARMQVYFIDNDDYFKRRLTTIDSKGLQYKDNDERSIFFVRGVLETIKKLRWMPDIIDCHGWMGALTGLYIKTSYADDPLFKGTKIVYSLYNDDFKDPFAAGFDDKLMYNNITKDQVKALAGTVDFETLQKFAIDYADGVIQAEETVNANVLDYAKSTSKKFLAFPGMVLDENKNTVETTVEAINDFYNNL